METPSQTNPSDYGSLAEDARTLLAATADVAGEHVGAARRRLHTALETGKVMFGRVEEEALKGAKTADRVVRTHPYQAVAIALGAGALIGLLMAIRYSSKSK